MNTMTKIAIAGLIVGYGIVGAGYALAQNSGGTTTTQQQGKPPMKKDAETGQRHKSGEHKDKHGHKDKAAKKSEAR